MYSNITTTSSYQLELPKGKTRIFVTQLGEDELEEEKNEYNEIVRKIPVVIERAGRLLEHGFNTLQKTLLLKRQNDFIQLNAEIEKKKEVYNERIRQCLEDERKMNEKKLKIKSYKKKFDIFIEENNRKKKRAMKKYKDELKEKKLKLEEIKLLESQREEMRMKLASIQKKLQLYEKYGQYLNSVVDKLPFEEIDVGDDNIVGLIARYETLEESCTILKESIAKNQKLVEEYSLILQNLPSESSKELMIYGKDLALSQNMFELMQSKNLRKEQRTLKREIRFRNNSEILGQLCLAIENILSKCEQDNHIVASRKSISVIQKLDRIEQFFKDRDSVYKMASSNLCT